jgi:hypothetical protein
MRRRTWCILTVLIVIPVGIAWRALPLHLPFFAWKYGGSVLWTVALYWTAAALLPRLRPASVALLSAVLSMLVEFSRLVNLAPLNAFRATLAGKLFLGRYFSVKNIAAYWVAIAVLLVMDINLMKIKAKPLPEASHD